MVVGRRTDDSSDAKVVVLQELFDEGSADISSRLVVSVRSRVQLLARLLVFTATTATFRMCILTLGL